jgi:hypothetical protein
LVIGISRNPCRQIYLHEAAISHKLDFGWFYAKSPRLRILPIEPISAAVLGWSLPPTLGWTLQCTLRWTLGYTLQWTLQCALGWTLYPTLHPTLRWTLGYTLLSTLLPGLHSTLQWSLHPTLGWTLQWTLQWSLGARVWPRVRSPDFEFRGDCWWMLH